MKDNLISVIVPIYNSQLFLAKCIESIQNQLYKNLEIILVDDGSIDSSLSICNKYSQKDNRIKVYHQENSGVSAARNYGLQVCTGEYVCFVDSDDYLDVNVLS